MKRQTKKIKSDQIQCGHIDFCSMQFLHRDNIVWCSTIRVVCHLYWILCKIRQKVLLTDNNNKNSHKSFPCYIFRHTVYNTTIRFVIRFTGPMTNFFPFLGDIIRKLLAIYLLVGVDIIEQRNFFFFLGQTKFILSIICFRYVSDMRALSFACKNINDFLQKVLMFMQCCRVVCYSQYFYFHWILFGLLKLFSRKWEWDNSSGNLKLTSMTNSWVPKKNKRNAYAAYSSKGAWVPKTP